MASKYYIINSSTFSTINSILDKDVVWNVAKNECIIEVNLNYTPPSYIQEFNSSNECQDWINNSTRIDNWIQLDESEIP